MKNLDYLAPKCEEFNLKHEGMLCISTENEGFTSFDYNEDWFNNL